MMYGIYVDPKENDNKILIFTKIPFYSWILLLKNNCQNKFEFQGAMENFRRKCH